MTDRNADSPTFDGVTGERGAPLIRRALSMQARYSNRLAMCLMVALGVGAIAWYYGHQVTRQRQIVNARRANVSVDAATEMHLPPIEAVRAPVEAGFLDPVSQPPALGVLDSADRISAVASAPLADAVPALLQATPTGLKVGTGNGRAGDSARVDRRYGGETYAGEDVRSVNGGAAQARESTTGPVASNGEASSNSTMRVVVADPPVLSGQLAGPAAAPISARRQSGRSLLLSKGTFIDCTLETAIDSTLPGITTCVTAGDTYGTDGRSVLLRRGTRLFGETQGQVQQGAARLYVLWSEARTPDGIVVPLASPGTDELGRSGLRGTIERHFWQRFGAAILLSMVDGAIQAGVQASSSRNGGTVVYAPGTTQDVTTEVLKSTVAIPPTVTKRNGDRIEVLVARDVDFSDVYAMPPGGGS